MKIIGLTGSIAAGKSTVSKWFNELGIATHDADLVVHELLKPGGGAVSEVLAMFGPHFGSLASGINRELLGNEVFAAPQKRNHLESILHPMVRAHRDTFVEYHGKIDAPAVVLDVPLLFETNSDKICDYVIVVYATDETTVIRAMSRPGMTYQKLQHILASQMPMDDKIKRADLALNSDLPKQETHSLLMEWLSKVGLSMFVTKYLKS